jgi:hypothetical protein
MAKALEHDQTPLARIHAERRAALPAAQMGERSRWRDNRLMALVVHKRKHAS